MFGTEPGNLAADKMINVFKIQSKPPMFDRIGELIVRE
jgi:hypothetical protein